MTDSGAERAARRAIQFLRDIDWSASSNEWKYERMAAIIREETGTRDICGNCDHGVIGGKPCEYCKGSGYEERREQSIEETGTQYAQFAKFAGRILESQRNEAGDVDGAFIEECLIECGLYQPTKVTEPCGENCQCEEFGFPTTCNKLTDAAREALRACWALPAAPDEGGTK